MYNSCSYQDLFYPFCPFWQSSYVGLLDTQRIISFSAWCTEQLTLNSNIVTPMHKISFLTFCYSSFPESCLRANYEVSPHETRNWRGERAAGMERLSAKINVKEDKGMFAFIKLQPRRFRYCFLEEKGCTCFPLSFIKWAKANNYSHHWNITCHL